MPSPMSSSTPSPFVPTSWELREVQLAPPHHDAVITDVSADGGLVVFRDAHVYDHTYLLVYGGLVQEIVPPGDEDGVPGGAQMFPDGKSLLFVEGEHAWIYDIARAVFDALPDPPGTSGGWFVPLPGGRIAAFTGPVASWEFGGVTNTQVWLFNRSTAHYERLGSRHDGIFMLALVDGIALVVDRSPSHDNSDWVLLRVAWDGTDHELYQFRGGAQDFALAPDGRHLAIARGSAGANETWLVDLSTGTDQRISEGAVATDGRGLRFSPDGLQVAVEFADGHSEAFSMDGSSVTSLASLTVGWFGVQ